jgi:hypothetical protein
VVRVKQKDLLVNHFRFGQGASSMMGDGFVDGLLHPLTRLTISRDKRLTALQTAVFEFFPAPALAGVIAAERVYGLLLHGWTKSRKEIIVTRKIKAMRMTRRRSCI